MLTCIYGGNGSGKSRFAESLVAKSGDPRYYIATMIPYGESGAQRVQKHIKQRENLRFTTLERPYLDDLDEIPEDAIVLLEDASNLIANWIFVKKGDYREALDRVLKLSERVKELYIVCISGYRREDFSGETADYVDALEQVNKALFEKADIAYEMIDGQPCLRKGEEK